MSIRVSDMATAWVAGGMRRALLRSASAAVLAVGALPGWALAQTGAAPEVAGVVVTAQRRAERIQEVPISISVLSGEQLDRDASESVNDVISQVAGVYSFDTGQNGGTKFSMRGVTSNTSNFNGSSTVGYYLDDVPFGFNRIPTSPDANAYDMERVEVLRGPQGTLYGVNSVNGVVRIITKDPDLDDYQVKMRAWVSGTYEGGTNTRGDFAVNMPVVPGRLALRAVVGYQDMSGWMDQPLAHRKNVNDSETETYRLKLRAKPVENLDAQGIVWLSRDKRGGPSVGPDNYEQTTRLQQPLSTEYDLYGLTLTYDLPGASLTSATSSIDYRNKGLLENSGSRIATILPAKLFAQEFRAVSTVAGSLQWSGGAIYRSEKDQTISDLPQVFVYPSHNYSRSRSFAVFGELKYAFADGLFDVTGGLRYFEDHTRQGEFSRFFTGVPAKPITTKEKFDSLTPRIVLAAHPNPDLDLYASYGQGFRSGFAQGNTVLAINPNARPVREDLLVNYEVGAKGRLFDGRVSYEAAAYYINWQDSVQQVLVPFGTVTIAMPMNSEDINGAGFDASVAVALTDQLQVSGTASWNDLHFDKDVLAGAAILFRKGERPDESPETTLGARIDYSTPVFGGDWQLRLSGGVNYVANVSSRVVAGSRVTRLYGDDILNSDVRATVISPKGWSASLFVNNLANKDPSVRVFGNATNRNLDSRMRPRTVGLQLDLEL